MFLKLNLNIKTLKARCVYSTFDSSLNLIRGVAFALNVAPVDWNYQVRPSGLRTMPCVRPASIIAAVPAVCATSPIAQLPLCSHAACAIGWFI